ncbi:MAG: glycosyltransferase family 2 protein [Bryobacterales bacterium]|nr:glycosyltransferase family 2 protein [Bryobacterales bacterium]
MRSLSIIIPAYNEETRLPATLDRILEYLREREWAFIEVLVVDDGSKDKTAEIVREYSSRAAAVQLISNPGNRGKGYAVRNGMLQAKGVWRLFTDSDLSAPIEELDKLLAAAEKEKALVSFGSRALDRSLVSVHQPLARELSGRIFNLVMRVVMRLPFRDTQCGFKLYHAEAAAKIFPRQQLDGFGFDVEDLFLARKLGLKAVEVPVRWANVEGTRVSLTSGIKAFGDLVVIRWHQLVGKYRQ